MLSVKLKVTQLCLTLQPHGLYSPWHSPGQNTGMGSLSLLQGIIPTQGSNPCLPHCWATREALRYKPQRTMFLTLGATESLDWIISFGLGVGRWGGGEGCPVHCKMFSTISELFQLDGLDSSLALSNIWGGGWIATCWEPLWKSSTLFPTCCCISCIDCINIQEILERKAVHIYLPRRII